MRRRFDSGRSASANPSCRSRPASGCPSSPAASSSALRGGQSLLRWIEVGSFSLQRGTQRLSIVSERADQSSLFVDAVYLTADADEEPPAGWNPLARPTPRSTPVKRRRTMFSDDAIAAA